MLVLHVDVEVVSIASVARYTHVAGIQVEQATLAFAGNGLREKHIPAQAIIQSQRGGNSPLILAIEEPPLLPLGGGGVLNDGAKEVFNIAQRKGGEAYTLATRAGGDRTRKLKLPGKQVVIVDADEVVERPTNVSAKADVVVANGVRPVVHPLILTFYLIVFLGGGAIGDDIATVHPVGRDRDLKLRQPTGE